MLHCVHQLVSLLCLSAVCFGVEQVVCSGFITACLIQTLRLVRPKKTLKDAKIVIEGQCKCRLMPFHFTWLETFWPLLSLHVFYIFLIVFCANCSTEETRFRPHFIQKKMTINVFYDLKTNNKIKKRERERRWPKKENVSTFPAVQNLFKLVVTCSWQQSEEVKLDRLVHRFHGSSAL